jgi:hypothetical protein
MHSVFEVLPARHSTPPRGSLVYGGLLACILAVSSDSPGGLQYAVHWAMVGLPMCMLVVLHAQCLRGVACSALHTTKGFTRLWWSAGVYIGSELG